MHERRTSPESLLRPVFSISRFAVATALTLVLFSCAAPSEEQARETVREFVQALQIGNMEELSSFAPFIEDLDAPKKEKLHESFQDFEDWEIREVQIEGRKARVTAHFSSPENSVDIVFPLKSEGGRWVLEEKIRYRSTIDVIPAE